MISSMFGDVRIGSLLILRLLGYSQPDGYIVTYIFAHVKVTSKHVVSPPPLPELVVEQIKMGK